MKSSTKDNNLPSPPLSPPLPRLPDIRRLKGVLLARVVVIPPED